MRFLFERSGLRLSAAQLEQFWRFHELLRARNEELDLTRLHNFENMVLKLYVDSALVATLVDLPSPLLDLGTGAGFPGIPLKIVRPDVRLVLAEAKHQRVEFLQEAVRHLGLRDVDIVPHRIGRKYEGRVAGVITRAVETMQETLRHLAPWLPLGARVLFMKGPESQSEVDAFQNEFAGAYRITLDRSYAIPQTPHRRRLIVVERLTSDFGTGAEVGAAARMDADADLVDADEEDVEASSGTHDVFGTAPEDGLDAQAADELEAGVEERLEAVIDDGEDSVPDLDDLADLSEDDVDEEALSLAVGVAAGEPLATSSERRLEISERRSTREVREIQSTTNATFKQLAALHSGRGVRRAGLALIAGIRPILEVVRDFPERCVAWISDGPPAPPSEVPPAVIWYRMNRDLLRRIDVIGTGPPLLLVRVPEFHVWSEAEWPAGCTLFVPFQDPENVGAILRSAAAFGVAQVVLLAEAAHPFHPKSVRAAGGSALLRLQFRRGPSIASLEPDEVPLLTLGTTGQDIGSFHFPATFGLLPGMEGPGLPEGLRTPEALQIPMQPGVESLNAATATAIALFLWRRQADPGSKP